MTQRDWQKDMERVKIFEHAKTLCNNPFPPSFEYEPTEVVLGYWLQEAKERGEREQRLKEEIEGALRFISRTEHIPEETVVGYIRAHFNQTMSTLYPDTPAPKEGSHD